jgi:hypothetical protein
MILGLGIFTYPLIKHIDNREYEVFKLTTDTIHKPFIYDDNTDEIE